MRVARLAWLVLGCNLAVILWGAVVRATGSGAGCGNHWPLCNGQVLPRPERLETLIELSHRLSSGLALLLVVGLWLAVRRSRTRGDPTRLGAGLSVLFILAEAAVGAGLVLFDLVADNASMARAMFMAVHLVNTFLLLASLALTAHWASGGAALDLGRRGPTLALVGLGLVAMLAAGTSGAIAALGDTLFPSDSLGEALARDLSPASHLLVRLRLLHPTLAVGAAAVLWLLAARLQARASDPERAHGWARAVQVLALLQLALGFVNVALLAPVWLQVAHLLLADLLWLSLVLLAAHVLAAPAGQRTEPLAAAAPAPAR